MDARKQIEKRVSPCLRCRRVPFPERCENKRCQPWRQWFARRWEQMRQLFGQEGQA